MLVVIFVAFANSLDLDQVRQIVRSDMGPNSLSLMVFLKDFLKMLISKTNPYDKEACKINKSCEEYFKAA